MRSAPPLAALALAVTVLLTGCVPEAPDIDPPPEPTSESVFASDEEALAAATDAYKAYLAMSDLILQAGGEQPERIAPLVAETWLPKELKGISDFATTGRHQKGASAFSDVTLQRIDEQEVVVYVCHDATDIRIIDKSGADVTPDSLAAPWNAEITFEVAPTTGGLLLAGNEPWVRDGIC